MNLPLLLGVIGWIITVICAVIQPNKFTIGLFAVATVAVIVDLAIFYTVKA